MGIWELWRFQDFFKTSSWLNLTFYWLKTLDFSQLGFSTQFSFEEDRERFYNPNINVIFILQPWISTDVTCSNVIPQRFFWRFLSRAKVQICARNNFDTSKFIFMTRSISGFDQELSHCTLHSTVCLSAVDTVCLWPTILTLNRAQGPQWTRRRLHWTAYQTVRQETVPNICLVELLETRI